MFKRKLLLLFIASFVCIINSQAQFSRYLVNLKNKGNTPFTFSSPLAYLSQKAIDRRLKYNIAIDSTDLPPTPSYITQIKNVPNVTILNVSKWFNSVSILTTDANAIATINSFPFVQNVSGLAARAIPVEKPINDKFEIAETILPFQVQQTEQVTADFYNYGTGSFNEIHLHNGEFLHNIGLRGQNMVMSILDAGFFNYINLRAFDSVKANNQVLSTWDFVNRETSVLEDNSHGMQCFSTIAANIPGVFIGKAPKANFHLFRTEDVNGEYLIEEHNWICGAERADSLGTDIISSSLGYTIFNLPGSDHSYNDRNGNTAIISIAADLAAKKGILVFNAVGNIADTSTHFLATPADADSIIAVGSVNTSGLVASNSSFGPSSDGQIKPDIASVGVAALIQLTSNNIGAGFGTSYACPNMAGLATCLWQGFPEFNNMKIVRTLQQSASIVVTPNDRIGYGIPNMKLAFSKLLTDFATSLATVNTCNATVNWISKDVAAMKYEIERKLPNELVFTKVAELNPQAGASLATHSYQFNNAIVSPSAGAVSYRIRQIIDTAAASLTEVYIDTATVNISAACLATGTGNIDPHNISIAIQPNPALGNTATLIIETPYAVNKMLIAMYDTKGRLIMQLHSSKTSGKKMVDLSINNLAPGEYYIKVSDGAKTIGSTSLLKL